MNFSETTLNAIVNECEAQGCTSATLIVQHLRPQLAAIMAVRRAAKASGLSVQELGDARSKTYYALGAVCRGMRWAVYPEVRAIDGLAGSAAFMADLLAWKLPGAPLSDLTPQFNSAYVGLSRGGKAHIQQMVDADTWADVYVFKTEAAADAYANAELHVLPKMSGDIKNLVRPKNT